MNNIKFKIVTDSSSDVTYTDGVEFSAVPLKIRTNEKEFSDTPDLDVGDMLSHLEGYKGKSYSSCPNSNEWYTAFGDAENIFCVSITRNLSGSYNAGKTAAEEYIKNHPERKVYVFDTLSVGPECAILMERIKKGILDGESFETIVEKANSLLSRTHLFFALESLRNLANNGRANPLVAKMAGALGIRVIGKASDEGTLEVTDKVRGVLKTIDCLFANMKKAGYLGGRVRIHHCENENSAALLKDKILSLFPLAEVSLHPTRALCSFYAERGGLLVGFEDGKSLC